MLLYSTIGGIQKWRGEAEAEKTNGKDAMNSQEFVASFFVFRKQDKENGL